MSLSGFIKENSFLFLWFAAATGYFLLAPLSGYFYTDFAPEHYIIIHTVLESVSVFITLLCFGVVFHSHFLSKKTQDLFLAVTLLAVGLIDVAHMLSYNGMHDFITPNTVNKATQLWIAARLAAAVGFVSAAFVRQDTDKPWLRPRVLITGGITLAASVAAWIVFYPEAVPAMFVPGEGLTPLKVSLEYFIVALNVVAAALFFRLYRNTDEDHYFYVIGAMALSVFSELFFTLYASPFDVYNLMGHLYKVGAYMFVYLMLFATSVKKPSEELIQAREILREYSYHLEDMVMQRTSDLEEKNRELAELNKIKNEFLAVCSHDMKSPLQSTMLMLDLTLMEADGPLTDRQKENIEAVRRNEEELLGLITNLLDIARQEDGADRLNPAHVDVGEMLDSWASRHSALARGKGVEFSVETLYDGPMVVSMGRFRVKQALNNLVANAFKFTDKGGRITLSVSDDKEDGVLTLSMFNTGPTIPEDKLSRIFEKYAMTGESRLMAREGTGLGLHIAKGIAEMHGGSIWAENVEGIGTRFTFTLPRNPGAGGENVGEAASAGPH